MEGREEKRRFSEERELELVKVERARDKGKDWFNEMEETDKVEQKKKRDGAEDKEIEVQQVVQMYKRRGGVLRYLRKSWEESRWKRVVRFKIRE